MRPAWVLLLRAAGPGRALLVALTTAVVSGLLLTAVSILRLGSERTTPFEGPGGDVGLLGPIADPGTRGGAALAPLLLTVPLVLLLDQAVRLGSSARERRYAALAVAGATRADRRRWGVVEVGLPAAVGGLLGVGVWLLLRLVLGTALAPQGWALVPTATGPGAWTAAVVGLVAGFGVLVGWRQGGREAALLPGAAPRPARPPRWWPLLAVGLAVVLVVPALVGGSTVSGALVVVLLVGGLAGASPWLAWRSARFAAPRLTSPAALLALRRLEADPRPAGRAAAAVGAVGLVGGFLGPFAVGVLENTGSSPGYYLGPAALVAVLAALAVVVVSATLALHSTETVLQRRREMASLVATGVPVSVISASQRVEVLVATVPLALLGSLLAGPGFGLLSPEAVGPLLAGLGSAALTVVVVALAGVLTTRAVRRWVVDAVRPGNLRTE